MEPLKITKEDLQQMQTEDPDSLDNFFHDLCWEVVHSRKIRHEDVVDIVWEIKEIVSKKITAR